MKRIPKEQEFSWEETAKLAQWCSLLVSSWLVELPRNGSMLNFDFSREKRGKYDKEL